MTETGGQPPVSFPVKDVAGLLFLLRRLTRRGRNAACGQCPASGRARDGRFYRSRLASVTVYASPSPFSDERPSSRFRGIFSPSKRRRLRYSTVGLTRYRTRGTGATGAPSRCPL
ncbi:hypothetical protein QFW10_004489 [Escherichia coli]|nr:hypothetical protein [Escherichia coli]